MVDWLSGSWGTVGFVAGATALSYVTMLVAVRVAGRRTVAQLSAFDVIVTVALGSLLASTVVTKEPSYTAATTAIVTLLTLQVAVAALRRRSSRFERLLEFAPEVVVREGRFDLPRGLLSSQLSESELRSLLRHQGVSDVEGVLVVLEPTGSISVLPATRAGEASSGEGGEPAGGISSIPATAASRERRDRRPG